MTGKRTLTSERPSSNSASVRSISTPSRTPWPGRPALRTSTAERRTVDLRTEMESRDVIGQAKGLP